MTRRVLDECFSSAKSEVDDITFLAMWFQKIQVVILLQNSYGESWDLLSENS